jgi:hypothetical protein
MTGLRNPKWHKRFGHISISGLQQLHHKQLVDNFHLKKQSEITDCDACAQAKLTRTPFPNHYPIKSSAPGERTHTDVWGPARETSVGGAKYYLLCIDDYSRFATIYFMKEKAEVTKYLKQYLSMIKIQYNMHPKVIRTDNGKE